MVADLYSAVAAPYIESRLAEFHRIGSPLLGLSGSGDMHRFVSLLADAAKVSQNIEEFADDPVLAQVLNNQQRSATDEACWLLFLYCYIGNSGLLDAIHRHWTWEKASADADTFEKWLTNNQRGLKSTGNLSSVHKYQIFDQHRAEAMGDDVKSYIAWVNATGGHVRLFQHAIAKSEGKSTIAFDRIYSSMNEHARFKKQIKLDYLCLIGHLKIADIDPGQFYFSDVLHLKKAARQLFSGHPSATIPLSELNELAHALTDFLGCPFSIAVMYRALMDWGEEKLVPVNLNFRRY